MNNLKNTRSNIKVAALPAVELAIRLSEKYDAESVREIFEDCIDTNEYSDGDGLLITFSQTDNMFVVVSSSEEFDSVADLYVPDTYLGLVDKILCKCPETYNFIGGGKFSKAELKLITKARKSDDDTSKLICKMLSEMMVRNGYNYTM